MDRTGRRTRVAAKEQKKISGVFEKAIKIEVAVAGPAASRNRYAASTMQSEEPQREIASFKDRRSQ